MAALSKSAGEIKIWESGQVLLLLKLHFAFMLQQHADEISGQVAFYIQYAFP
jgi:hypothetical protein